MDIRTDSVRSAGHSNEIVDGEENLTGLGPRDTVTIGETTVADVQVDGTFRIIPTVVADDDAVETQIGGPRYSNGDTEIHERLQVSATFEDVSGEDETPGGEVYAVEFKLEESPSDPSVQFNPQTAGFANWAWNPEASNEGQPGESFFVLVGEDADGDDPVYVADRVDESDIDERYGDASGYTTSIVTSNDIIRIDDVGDSETGVGWLEVPDDL